MDLQRKWEVWLIIAISPTMPVLQPLKQKTCDQEQSAGLQLKQGETMCKCQDQRAVGKSLGTGSQPWYL